MDDIPFMEGDDDVWVLNYTHQPLQKSHPPPKVELPYKWEQFNKEGDLMFDYMINNYEKIFDGETIRGFYITSGTPGIPEEYGNLYDEHRNEIQKKLISWIENERIQGTLFNKVNWKPFREWNDCVSMYMGYNKFFTYKQYYFQLSLDTHFMDHIHSLKVCEYPVHFNLVLFGWKDSEHEILQPDNRIIVSPDNLLPEIYWKNSMQ